MSYFRRVAEEKIQQAMRQGKLANLSGRGKPLPVEDYSGVPEDLRIGFKILKNAGVLPPEMELRKEILTLRDLVSACTDLEQEKLLQQKLKHKILRYRIMMERNRKKCSLGNNR